MVLGGRSFETNKEKRGLPGTRPGAGALGTHDWGSLLAGVTCAHKQRAGASHLSERPGAYLGEGSPGGCCQDKELKIFCLPGGKLGGVCVEPTASEFKVGLTGAGRVRPERKAEMDAQGLQV